MAHYLTFGTDVSCTVNGVSVSTGYELHDGDVIVATATNDRGFLVNTNWHAMAETVDVYDSDVEVSAYASGGASY